MRALLPWLLLLSLPLQAAGLYRWVDEKGQVHYTQTPPPGTKVDKVRPAPPPDANPGMDAMRSYNQAAGKAAQEGAKKKAEEQKKQEERGRLCAQARDNLEILETRAPYRVAKENEDGSIGRLTPEEYDKKLQDNRELAAKNCS